MQIIRFSLLPLHVSAARAKFAKNKLLDDLISAEQLLNELDTVYGPVNDSVNLPKLAPSELSKPVKPIMRWQTGVNTQRV